MVKDDSNRIRKILSVTHLNESNKDFKKFLKGKTPSTIKRYKSYRKLVTERRQAGLNFREEKRHLIFTKIPRSGADIRSHKEIPETDIPATYAQIYEFVCETPSLDEKHHRHSYETRKKKPNRRQAFSSHARVFPDHQVIRFEYEGTWVRY